jgi:hypothetical protein
MVDQVRRDAVADLFVNNVFHDNPGNAGDRRDDEVDPSGVVGVLADTWMEIVQCSRHALPYVNPPSLPMPASPIGLISEWVL